jgi:hypothetical protein
MAFGRRRALLTLSEQIALCGFPIRDTAGCQPALRGGSTKMHPLENALRNFLFFEAFPIILLRSDSTRRIERRFEFWIKV